MTYHVSKDDHVVLVHGTIGSVSGAGLSLPAGGANRGSNDATVVWLGEDEGDVIIVVVHM